MPVGSGTLLGTLVCDQSVCSDLVYIALRSWAWDWLALRYAVYVNPINGSGSKSVVIVRGDMIRATSMLFLQRRHEAFPRLDTCLTPYSDGSHPVAFSVTRLIKYLDGGLVNHPNCLGRYVLPR